MRRRLERPPIVGAGEAGGGRRAVGAAVGAVERGALGLFLRPSLLSRTCQPPAYLRPSFAAGRCRRPAAPGTSGEGCAVVLGPNPQTET